MKHPLSENIREAIFGVEDGAVGNLGVVIGMAQAAAPNKFIILAGFTTVLAQTISMSAGTYLSVKSEKAYFSVNKKHRKFGKQYAKHKVPLISTAVMGLAVMLGALIPLSSFFFFEGISGIIPAIIITLTGLFLVGAFKSKYTNENWFKSGLEILIIGGLAAGAGYIIGSLFSGI